MGRLSTFSDQAIFDEVGAQLARGEAIRLQNLVENTGVSVGSIYHRFGSKEGVVAAAWLDSLRTFQKLLVSELTSGAPNAGERSALTTPQFCRTHRRRAIILALGRQEEFLTPSTPEEWAHEAETLNAEIATALSGFADGLRVPLIACQLGIMAYPLAAVRLYIPNKPVPKSIDAYVLSAYKSAIT